jgi:hypothetical protein
VPANRKLAVKPYNQSNPTLSATAVQVLHAVAHAGIVCYTTRVLHSPMVHCMVHFSLRTVLTTLPYSLSTPSTTLPHSLCR